MWMKVDDGLHAHRKTRAVTKSHPEKRRDASPMGLWVLAGSWAAQNGTDGWAPEDELDRWDDDWRALAGRLVRAGYWWPQQRDGEPGFGFTDWHDYNDPADMASKAGTFGNHVRWHVNEKRVDPDCEHCPKEPDRPDDHPDIAPESGGDRGAISGATHTRIGGAIALPEPEPDPNPTRPEPGARAIATRSGGDAVAVTAQTLVGEWIDHCPKRPAGSVIGQVSKHLKTMLDEGIEPERLRRALAEWNRKGLHPSTLPSVLHEIENRAPAKTNKQAAEDAMWERAMERAEQREREMGLRP